MVNPKLHSARHHHRDAQTSLALSKATGNTRRDDSRARFRADDDDDEEERGGGGEDDQK